MSGSKHRHVHACPECGQTVGRVHRHLRDRLMAIGLRVHRYRCTNPECRWEGIVSIPRPPSPPRNWFAWISAPSASWGARLGWMAVGAVCALAPIEGTRWLVQRQRDRAAETAAASLRAAEPQLLAPLPGESLDGLLLATQETPVPGRLKPLERRESCLWGVPGRNPYKGTARQVLTGARLPPEVVGKIDSMIVSGRRSGRVEITSKGIWTEDGRRRFDSNVVAMGFGNTLCFNTRVNFQPAHVEVADLYEATDAGGAKYSVMVPYVCGNVAVLAERAELPEVARSIPEPGTWASVVAALAAMAWAMRLRRASPRFSAQAADAQPISEAERT
jgi:predicted RNA-binding Zn-ribbon protein involved in translation (DUF1610 family)